MSDGNRLLLAGDIGGTKTTLALFTSEAGPRRPLAQATFPSGEHGSLENIVAQFLTGKNVRVTEASFGVAGPVVQGRAQVTNLPWGADEDALSRALDGAPVRLLNDLDAIAHAVPFLEPSDLETLNEGQPDKHGPLGQGFAHGVGMVMAERWLAEHYNSPDFEIVNHYTYAIVSDGNLQEGVASDRAFVGLTRDPESDSDSTGRRDRNGRGVARRVAQPSRANRPGSLAPKSAVTRSGAGDSAGRRTSRRLRAVAVERDA